MKAGNTERLKHDFQRFRLFDGVVFLRYIVEILRSIPIPTGSGIFFVRFLTQVVEILTRYFLVYCFPFKEYDIKNVKMEFLQNIIFWEENKI